MKQSVVFIKGNQDRAKENKQLSAFKKFNKEVVETISPMSVKTVSSNDYIAVPKASISVPHSRGCSRMNRFGNKDSLKICLDNFQRKSKNSNTHKTASFKNHYKMTKRMKSALLNMHKQEN